MRNYSLIHPVLMMLVGGLTCLHTFALCCAASMMVFGSDSSAPGNHTRMVLVLNGVGQEKPPFNTSSLFLTYPFYRKSAAQFVSKPNQVVGPEGLLYVKQREMAVTVPHDKNVTIIGSDDATSCIICILRHTGSGAVGLAHFDANGTEEGVLNLTNRVQELAMSGYPEGRYELSLIGGFSDAHNYSEELFYSLMHAFHKQVIEVDLVLACIGELNTIVTNGVHRPILYGAGVNIKTGEIFPATFSDKGPEQALRSTRLLTGDTQVLDIYDWSLGQLRIGPFNYKSAAEQWLKYWLNKTDEAILNRCSSSPDVEPPDFVMNLRATLQYMLDNPAGTVFRDNQPHYYRRDEQNVSWTPFHY